MKKRMNKLKIIDKKKKKKNPKKLLYFIIIISCIYIINTNFHIQNYIIINY